MTPAADSASPALAPALGALVTPPAPPDRTVLGPAPKQAITISDPADAHGVQIALESFAKAQKTRSDVQRNIASVKAQLENTTKSAQAALTDAAYREHGALAIIKKACESAGIPLAGIVTHAVKNPDGSVTLSVS